MLICLCDLFSATCEELDACVDLLQLIKNLDVSSSKFQCFISSPLHSSPSLLKVLKLSVSTQESSLSFVARLIPG